MTNNKLTAIILAGGKSTRMGRDKALIPIQGVPMLQLVCHIAQTCTDHVYVVTPWQEQYQHIVPPSCKFIQEVPLTEKTTEANPAINNKDVNLPPLRPPSSSLHLTHGPLVGFAQGLAQVETDWVLLLACDLPKLRVEVLQEWIAGLDRVPEDAIAALVQNNHRWEPLCGFYRRRCLSELNKYIEQGGRSFQEWLKLYPVQVLPLLDPQMIFNCNQPEDLL